MNDAIRTPRKDIPSDSKRRSSSTRNTQKGDEGIEKEHVYESVLERRRCRIFPSDSVALDESGKQSSAGKENIILRKRQRIESRIETNEDIQKNGLSLVKDNESVVENAHLFPRKSTHIDVPSIQTKFSQVCERDATTKNDAIIDQADVGNLLSIPYFTPRRNPRFENLNVSIQSGGESIFDTPCEQESHDESQGCGSGSPRIDVQETQKEKDNDNKFVTPRRSQRLLSLKDIYMTEMTTKVSTEQENQNVMIDGRSVKEQNTTDQEYNYVRPKRSERMNGLYSPKYQAKERRNIVNGRLEQDDKSEEEIDSIISRSSAGINDLNLYNVLVMDSNKETLIAADFVTPTKPHENEKQSYDSDDFVTPSRMPESKNQSFGEEDFVTWTRIREIDKQTLGVEDFVTPRLNRESEKQTFNEEDFVTPRTSRESEKQSLVEEDFVTPKGIGESSNLIDGGGNDFARFIEAITNSAKRMRESFSFDDAPKNSTDCNENDESDKTRFIVALNVSTQNITHKESESEINQCSDMKLDSKELEMTECLYTENCISGPVNTVEDKYFRYIIDINMSDTQNFDLEEIRYQSLCLLKKYHGEDRIFLESDIFRQYPMRSNSECIIIKRPVQVKIPRVDASNVVFQLYGNINKLVKHVSEDYDHEGQLKFNAVADAFDVAKISRFDIVCKKESDKCKFYEDLKYDLAQLTLYGTHVEVYPDLDWSEVNCMSVDIEHLKNNLDISLNDIESTENIAVMQMGIVSNAMEPSLVQQQMNLNIQDTLQQTIGRLDKLDSVVNVDAIEDKMKYDKESDNKNKSARDIHDDSYFNLECWRDSCSTDGTIGEETIDEKASNDNPGISTTCEEEDEILLTESMMDCDFFRLNIDLKESDYTNYDLEEMLKQVTNFLCKYFGVGTTSFHYYPIGDGRKYSLQQPCNLVPKKYTKQECLLTRAPVELMILKSEANAVKEAIIQQDAMVTFLNPVEDHRLINPTLTRNPPSFDVILEALREAKITWLGVTYAGMRWKMKLLKRFYADVYALRRYGISVALVSLDLAGMLPSRKNTLPTWVLEKTSREVINSFIDRKGAHPKPSYRMKKYPLWSLSRDDRGGVTISINNANNNYRFMLSCAEIKCYVTVAHIIRNFRSIPNANYDFNIRSVRGMKKMLHDMCNAQNHVITQATNQGLKYRFECKYVFYEDSNLEQLSHDDTLLSQLIAHMQRVHEDVLPSFGVKRTIGPSIQKLLIFSKTTMGSVFRELTRIPKRMELSKAFTPSVKEWLMAQICLIQLSIGNSGLKLRRPIQKWTSDVTDKVFDPDGFLWLSRKKNQIQYVDNVGNILPLGRELLIEHFAFSYHRKTPEEILQHLRKKMTDATLVFSLKLVEGDLPTSQKQLCNELLELMQHETVKLTNSLAFNQSDKVGRYKYGKSNNSSFRVGANCSMVKNFFANVNVHENPRSTEIYTDHTKGYPMVIPSIEDVILQRNHEDVLRSILTDTEQKGMEQDNNSEDTDELDNIITIRNSYRTDIDEEIEFELTVMEDGTNTVTPDRETRKRKEKDDVKVEPANLINPIWNLRQDSKYVRYSTKFRHVAPPAGVVIEDLTHLPDEPGSNLDSFRLIALKHWIRNCYATMTQKIGIREMFCTDKLSEFAKKVDEFDETVECTPFTYMTDIANNLKIPEGICRKDTEFLFFYIEEKLQLCYDNFTCWEYIDFFRDVYGQLLWRTRGQIRDIMTKERENLVKARLSMITDLCSQNGGVFFLIMELGLLLQIPGLRDYSGQTQTYIRDQVIFFLHELVDDGCMNYYISTEETSIPEGYQQLIDYVFGAEDHGITRKKYVQIEQSDLHYLKPGEWLNDSVMNLHFFFLQIRSAMNRSMIFRRPEGGDHVQFSYVPSNFLTMFANLEVNTSKVPMHTSSDLNYDMVQGMTENIGNVGIFSVPLVLIPVHVTRTHWTLMVLDNTKKKISYYDSLGYKGNAYCLLLLRYLQEEYKRYNVATSFPSESDYIIENVMDIPHQRNSWDCGMFVCMYAEKIVTGQELSFRDTDDYFTYLRRVLCYRLLQFIVHPSDLADENVEANECTNNNQELIIGNKEIGNEEMKVNRKKNDEEEEKVQEKVEEEKEENNENMKVNRKKEDEEEEIVEEKVEEKKEKCNRKMKVNRVTDDDEEEKEQEKVKERKGKSNEKRRLNRKKDDEEIENLEKKVEKKKEKNNGKMKVNRKTDDDEEEKVQEKVKERNGKSNEKRRVNWKKDDDEEGKLEETVDEKKEKSNETSSRTDERTHIVTQNDEFVATPAKRKYGRITRDTEVETIACPNDGRRRSPRLNNPSLGVPFSPIVANEIVGVPYSPIDAQRKWKNPLTTPMIEMTPEQRYKYIGERMKEVTNRDNATENPIALNSINFWRVVRERIIQCLPELSTTTDIREKEIIHAIMDQKFGADLNKVRLVARFLGVVLKKGDRKEKIVQDLASLLDI